MKFLLMVLAFVTLTAYAEDKDPRPDMHILASEIMALQKYMFSDAEFTAPANEAQIKKSLKSLDNHLAHLGKGTFQDDPSLKVNLSLLQQHIKDTSRGFNEGNKAFARNMLQSSLQLCIACHTRKKTTDFPWPEPDSKNIEPIDRADYLFATRQFKKGLSVYESLIESYPANHAGQWNVRRALLSIAVYYARVTEDPAAGATYFLKISKDEDLPLYLREETKAWSREFAKWAKEPVVKEEKMTETALLARATKLLKHDDFSMVSDLGRSFHIHRLRATVLLQKVLEAPGDRSPNKGVALLYLGQIYPRISSSLFFRFGEMYLKACIAEYPKTSSARSCYVALELLVNEGFSGSGGTNIPEDEQVELMRLRRLAF